MPKFRKKPVVIDAIQWTGSNLVEITTWHLSFGPVAESSKFVDSGVGMLTIPTLEGVTIASKGDWLIRGVKGEFYACKPDIFAATYEAVDAAAVVGDLKAKARSGGVSFADLTAAAKSLACPGCEALERGISRAPHSAVCPEADDSRARASGHRR